MLGAPGAGKGTQADLISAEFSLPHISTGDIFRKNMKEETELGLLAKKYIDGGNLVPDEVTISMLLKRVAEKDCENGYILDGFPRTIPQAEALEKALNERNEAIDYCIMIDVPDERIVKRATGRRVCPNCQRTYHITSLKPQKEGICDDCDTELITRKDDEPETVENRLFVYHRETEPIVEFYRQRNILKTFDGTKDISEIFSGIKTLLGGEKCQ